MKKATLTESGNAAILDTETGELTITEVPYRTAVREAPFFKTPWNHDTDAESLSTGLKCLDPSKTQQSHMADADINNILRKFMTTGELPLSNNPPQYLDIEKEFDLQDQMVTAYQVEQAWNQLPKEARAILQTPAKFVEWYDHCLETGNVQGLQDIGLIPKDHPKAPQEPPEPPKAKEGGTPAPEGAKAPPAPAGGDK